MPDSDAADAQAHDPAATGPIEAADIAIATSMARHRDHPAIRAVGAVSELADQPPLIVGTTAAFTLGLATGDRRLAEAGARGLASVLVATLIKGGIKRMVGRTRPNVLLEEGDYEVRPLAPNEGPWHSFPSGHTAGATAVARSVVRVYPEARLPAYGAAAAVGLVQLPRGAHYPSDVAAGLAVGFAAEAIVDQLFPSEETLERLRAEAGL